jgi:hypothetical protein
MSHFYEYSTPRISSDSNPMLVVPKTLFLFHGWQVFNIFVEADTPAESHDRLAEYMWNRADVIIDPHDVCWTPFACEHVRALCITKSLFYYDYNTHVNILFADPTVLFGPFLQMRDDYDKITELRFMSALSYRGLNSRLFQDGATGATFGQMPIQLLELNCAMSFDRFLCNAASGLGTLIVWNQ